jgi:hypothetical protein
MLKRGDKVKYTATAPKYDPLHNLTGVVTHLNGDTEGQTSYKGDDNEVWVEWDGSLQGPCWVDESYLKKL